MSVNMNDLLSREAVKNKQALYWRNRRVDTSTCVSLIRHLSVDRPRPGQRRSRLELEIGDATTESLRRISAGSDMAVYILLVTVFKAVAARLTGQPLVSVLSPIYRKGGDGGQAAPGCDYVLFQDLVNPESGLRENSFVTQRTVIGAYSNQDHFAREVGIARDLAGEHALITFEPLHGLARVADRSPLVIRLAWCGPRLIGELAFDPDVLEPQLVEQLASSLAIVLEQSSRETSRAFSELAPLPEPEARRLEAFSRGAARPIEDCALHELFERQTVKTPSATAVIFGDQRVSYAELDEQSDRIARRLVARGVVPGDYVTLLCSRSVDMVAAILAVGKAHAAFVPVSPEAPARRLAEILEHTGSRWLVTNLEPSRVPGDLPALPIAALVGAGRDAVPLPAAGGFARSSVAYAIFTSGSTAVPKGVVIEHLGIVNAVVWRAAAYGLSAAHRTLLALAYNFDGFILNLFSALATGATTVLVSDEDARSALALVGHVRTHAVTQMALTPALFHGMLEESTASDLSSLSCVTLAGDVTRSATIALCRALSPTLRLCNEYGPTESSVVSTFHSGMDADAAGIIGRPIDNVVVRILDNDMQPVPLGVYGQLALSGPGLARGYLNNPEETAERFVIWRRERVYLTGDVGRWRPDGTIEFRGRSDDQIKLRGYRIELEGIRRHVLSYEGVKEAVVFVDEAGQDAAIVACFTESGAVDRDALLEHLRARLPEYMVPAELVRLSGIPLTEAGKYDLAELRARVTAEGAKANEQPATDIEQRLAAMWLKLLDLETVGVNKSFFALGGHSLKATRLLTRIHAEFGVVLPLEDVFRFNTIRQLATRIEHEWVRPSAAIAATGQRASYPVSSAQQRMLVLAADDELHRSYSVPVVFEVSGDLDRARLEHAINTVVKRHDSLRTYFVWQDDRPRQAIARECTIAVRQQAIAATEPLGDAIRRLTARFDLGRGPLLAVTVLDAGTRGRYLLFELHHAIVDEPSLGILFGELQQAYEGSELAPAPSTRYVDYAVWQRERQSSPAYLEKLAYWKEKLAGAQLGPIALPFEAGTDGYEPGRGGQHVVVLEDSLARSIRALCRSQELTLFMFFVGAFALHLHRFTGQQEIVLGSPISERFRPETHGVIGLFLNTLLLHHRIDGSITGSKFLQTVKKELLLDVASSEAQLEDVLGSLAVRRSVDNRAAFNVMVAAVEDRFENLRLGGAEARPIDVHNGTAKFDLLLEVRGSDDDIRLVFEYACDRLGVSTIEPFGQQLVALLQALVAAPDTRLDQLAPLERAERWCEDARRVDRGSDAASSQARAPGPTPARRPGSSLEAELVDVWARVLGLDPEKIRVNDSFFMLGGDSIAITVVAKTVREWGYTVKLGELFEHDTIEKLCALLDSKPIAEIA